jgi:hypothetical protein
MFRLFKSKEPAPQPAPPVAPPTPPPQANAPDAQPVPPAEPVKPAGALAFPPASQKPDASGVQKIVPRQGSIAAALKAATAPTSANASPTQSAIFRPKVSVIIKPGGATPTAPAPDAPAAAAAPEAVPASNLPASITIPSKELLALLPDHALIENASSHSALPANVSIPTQEIVSQLSKGRVQLPITMLVALIPKEIIEPSFSATEDVKIKLPLHLILPQLPESVMSLPSGQAKQEVDPNLASPFSERGKGSGAPQPKTPSMSAVVKPTVSPVAVSEAGKPPIPTIKPPSVVAPSPSLNPAEAAKASSQAMGLPSKPVLPPKSSVIPAPTKPPPIPPPTSIPKPHLPPPSIPPVSAPATPPPQSEAKPPATPVIPPLKLGVPAVTPPPVETKPPAKASDSSVTKPLAPPVIPPPNIPAPSIGQKPVEKTPVIPPPTSPAAAAPAQVSGKPLMPPPSIDQKPAEKAPEIPAAKPDDGAALKNLSEWLGIPEKDVKLPEIAQKVKEKMKLEGVLIATKDGLPLVTAMPGQFDVNSWSGFASHLFKKFGEDGHSLAGSPKKYLLSLGSSWISAYDEKGIYLFLVHSLDVLTPEFEQQGFKLAKDLSQFCDK